MAKKIVLDRGQSRFPNAPPAMQQFAGRAGPQALSLLGNLCNGASALTGQLQPSAACADEMAAFAAVSEQGGYWQLQDAAVATEGGVMEATVPSEDATVRHAFKAAEKRTGGGGMPPPQMMASQPHEGRTDAMSARLKVAAAATKQRLQPAVEPKQPTEDMAEPKAPPLKRKAPEPPPPVTERVCLLVLYCSVHRLDRASHSSV